MPSLSLYNEHIYRSIPDGGIYIGSVKSVLPDGKIHVFVPELNSTMGPMRAINSIVGQKLSVGEQVVCAHLNASDRIMVVLGKFNPASIGDYVQSLTAGDGISITGGSGEGSSPVISTSESTRDLMVYCFMDVG